MPIKRSEALQPLSRQHHNGLLFCLLLGKGLKKQAALKILQDFCIAFYEEDLLLHFQLEEHNLLILSTKYPLLAEGIARMKDEHTLISELFTSLRTKIKAETLSSIETVVEQHIRFEERQLFPLIESTITPQELQNIGVALANEPEHNCMNYPVKFWE
ncbi:MAG: hemerythrin domain-containing protein [Bacteroidota bacterium]|nr:hemerythrin domain-containing protein [Bacteroidota bacterium]